jgi:hypothetical protein
VFDSSRYGRQRAAAGGISNDFCAATAKRDELAKAERWILENWIFGMARSPRQNLQMQRWRNA